MRHSHTMRNYAKVFFAFAALATLSACADNTAVAPASEAPTVVAPANFLQVGNSIVFRVNNNRGITQKIGAHVISIPAEAICAFDEGYGPTYWNQDCKPMKGSIVVTATVFNGADGRPYIDFQPAMRFAPDKQVMLFLREGRSNGTKMMSIKYCNAVAYCVDESITDPSLKPFRIGRTSIIGRRVKHFSGYTIAYDEDCPGTVTDMGDGTYYCEEGGATRRSGYMVASGEDISDLMKDDAADDKGGKKDDQ